MRNQSALLAMNPAERRRSPRLLHTVPLVVRGELAGHKVFWGDTFTANISAHGALLVLTAKVGVGQRLVLMNPQNWQEENVHVRRLGTFDGSRTQVGVEFAQAVPAFWPVSATAEESVGP